MMKKFNNDKERIEYTWNNVLQAVDIPKHGLDGYEAEDIARHAFERGMQLQREITARKLGLLIEVEEDDEQ